MVSAPAPGTRAAGAPFAQPASSGTYAAAASSSASAPESRSSMTAAAVNDFDIDAIRKTVRSSGACPPAPSARAPKPAAWTSEPSRTMP